jgi:quercetin dioxygenase-like cupin family protein
MKTKTKVVLGAAVTAGAIGLAFATPIINLASPFLSSGNVDSDIQEHGVAKMSDGNYYNATLTTYGPSTISTQIAAFNPGGHNGWHSHPGLVAVTVNSGTIIWYDANCKATTYHAGDSWVEGSQRHSFCNSAPCSSPPRARGTELTSSRRRVPPLSASSDRLTVPGRTRG